MNQDFLNCIEFILKWAGEWSYTRVKGLSKMYGISQFSYDRYRIIHKLKGQSVKFISQSEVNEIYNQYWISSDAYKLKTPMSLIYFDTVMNEGIVIARKFLEKSNENCEIFLQLKQDYLYEISINNDNNEYIKSLQGRYNDLKQMVGY